MQAQRARIIDLERLHAPVYQASEFLDLLDSTQGMHHSHLERLLERSRNRVDVSREPENWASLGMFRPQ